MLGVCTRVRLPALVYDILLPKRKVPESDAWSVHASPANSKHWFTTYFLQREKFEVPESDAWFVHASPALSALYDILSSKRKMPKSDAWSVHSSPTPSPLRHAFFKEEDAGM